MQFVKVLIVSQEIYCATGRTRISKKKFKRICQFYLIVFFALFIGLHNHSMIIANGIRFAERKMDIFVPFGSQVLYDKNILDAETKDKYHVVVLKISQKESDIFLDQLRRESWGMISEEAHRQIRRDQFKEALSFFPSKRENSLGGVIYDKYPNLEKVLSLGLYDPDSRILLVIDRG